MFQIKYLSFTTALVLVLNVYQYVETAPHQRTLRLCSKSLSDALYLVCKDRGYNEPFSYSDGIESRRSPGPGLVDECCYHSCSLEQLEQYCKPLTPEENSNNDGIEESLRIVNLPFSPVNTLAGGETRTATDGSLKSKKPHHRHETTYRGGNRVDNKPKVVNKQLGWVKSSVRSRQDPRKSMKSPGKNEIGKSPFDNCQRRRRKRRRCSKAQIKAALANVPKFMIGTILPEPSDSVVLFPSKAYQDYWRVTQNFASVANRLDVPMRKTLINQRTYKNSQDIDRLLKS